MLIDRLFEKFALIYGDRFADKWKDTDQEAMRDTWSKALGSYEREHVAKAVEWLIQENPRPPNLVEFVLLCKRAKGSMLPAHQPAPRLPAPDNSAETLSAKERCMETMRKLKIGQNAPSHDWAWILYGKHKSGEKLSIAQLEALKNFKRNTGADMEF